MAQTPNHLYYTAQHQWIRQNEDGTATVGITDFAQETLGDIVFVELPDVGTELAANVQAASVEAVKSASDVYAPVAGKVVAINEDLIANPELANESPYDAGWFFVVQPNQTRDIAALLTAEQYQAETA
ncbi:glycine cleavage system protein GcvH [Kingella kingae]|uniref:glycine cleavage system protein GcvH n=1 Tax=Kingella kingae TaxID=504 RepID=UPI00254B83A2|nr:glycine cleavage system protein GcvH [Kingella kingae]MDK4649433.1 glycine cleavage system protein GcvH [Kingella kingae]